MGKVYISSLCLRLPGLPDAASPEQIATAFAHPLPHGGPEFRLDERTRVVLGPDEIPAGHAHAPGVRDSKSMATDVVSACVAVGAMMESAKLSPELLRRMPLHVAKGVCSAGAAKEIDDFIRTYFECESAATTTERNAQLFGRIYPLIVLKVLSNTLQSFLAQIHGPCGDATTFGNTSAGGFHALVEGAERVRRGQDEVALVGATQASDLLSAVTHLRAHPDLREYRESHGIAFLLLRSEKNLRDSGAPALAELSEWRAQPGVPADFDAPLPPAYASFLKGFASRAEPPQRLSVFSGGLFADDYREELAELRHLETPTASWFPSHGTLGATALLAHVAAGASCLHADPRLREVDCFDRDIYGRESWVRLRAPEPLA